MGQSNIHYPTQILSRAAQNGVFSDQALIQPFNKPVLVVSGAFSQEEIDSYTWCLKDPNIGSWVRRGTSNTSSAIPADDSLNVPQVRTGPGLSQNLTPSDQTRYILVIQGRSGAGKAKVLKEMSLPMAASAIMHEALNGYSTAFSAAYDGPSLRDLPVGAVFERASGLTAPKMNGANRMVISLVCFVAPRESEKRLSTG